MVSQMSDKYDRKNAGSEKQKFEADHVISYFKMEWKVLLAVTVSGADLQFRTPCRAMV